MNWSIKIIAKDNNGCGESPIWDPINQCILWIDADKALIFKLSLHNGEKSVVSRGLSVSGIALNRDGGLIIAGMGLHLWRNRNDYRTIIEEYEGEALVFNDIIADFKGRIYAGTYYWEEKGMEKEGKLYLINTDGSAQIMEDGIKLSNGLGFSPDNSLLYYTDSAARIIYKYDVEQDEGNLKNKRIFVKVPENEGIPDGLTVDAEGYVWSALWYGGQIIRYDPDGKVCLRIPIPAKQVSSVMFGGRNMTNLYITSAGKYWHSNLIPKGFNPEEPMGGSLYFVNTNIKGKYEHMANFL